MSNQRPKIGENEEDLLKLQEQFLKNSGRDDFNTQHRTVTSISTSDRERNLLENDAVNNIVERDVSLDSITAPDFNDLSKQPFPKAFLRDKVNDGSDSKEKGSLFRQQLCMNKRKANPAKKESESGKFLKASAKACLTANTSVIIDGTGLAVTAESKTVEKLVCDIHEENLAKISSMSEQDIISEQQRLRDNLDTSLISFLKKKRQKVLEQGTTETAMDLSESTLAKLPSNSVITTKNVTELCLTTKDAYPVKPSEAKKWMHMDKVESEKLAWMTDLPKPQPVDMSTGYTARFDFEGGLIPKDADIPVHKGLHHHGDEPEVPGYSLEELFIYGRSSVLQQRVLSLSVLAKILHKTKEGYYDECLSESLLSQVLNAGLVPMLRWALDDNSEGCLPATIAAIHALIVSIPDEVCLDRTFTWHRGEEMPFIQPVEQNFSVTGASNKKGRKDFVEEELTDAELVKLDVIKGFIRMDILPRLRYVLEILRPASPVVIHILEILIRIARHSLDSAFSVVKCPRLMKTICEEFLPPSWSSFGETSSKDQLTSLYGVPVVQAVKLIRILCTAGKYIAADLLAKYDIMSSIICYTSSDLRDGPLPSKESLNLCLASFHAWKVFLHYGLTYSSYVNLYPIIMRQLQFYQSLSVNIDVMKLSFDFDHANSHIGLLTEVVRLTSFKNEADSSSLPGWNQIQNLFPGVELCVKKWLWELTKSDEISHSVLRLVGSAVHFISVYYEEFSKQSSYNPVHALDDLNLFIANTVTPFMDSSLFNKLLSDLSRYSSMTRLMQDGKRRDPPTLPSLGSVLWNGRLLPILKEQSPFSFLGNFIHMLYTVTELHKGINIDIYSAILNHESVVSYLLRLLSIPFCLPQNWFNRFETQWLYHLVLICAAKRQACTQLSLYHKIACVVLLRLQRGDEVYAKNLLSRVIFNKYFISEYDDLTLRINELKLNVGVALESPSKTVNEDASCMQLLQQTCMCLPSICETYKTHFEDSIAAFTTNSWKSKETLAVSHFLVPLLNSEFAFSPIIDLHRMSKVAAAASLDIDEDLLQKPVLHCLQWCYLLKCWRTEALDPVSPELQFCRLATILLVSCDLFLVNPIRTYLESYLKKMAEACELTLSKLESISMREVASFHDMYSQLLEQFEAASYGDKLFASFILLAMQRHHPLHIRKTIWTNNTDSARIMRIKLNELLVPIENYLYPIEDDEDLLINYFTVLSNGTVRAAICPVLYLIAIHHLHNVLFNDSLKDSYIQLKHKIFNHLLNSKHKVLLDHIKRYKGPCKNSDFGFSLYDEPSETILNAIENAVNGKF